jgi:CO/xanthine dehydrogenase FAD-binding subunit
MRAIVPNYDMVAPDGLAAALALLSEAPGRYTPFAGGTDLMVVHEKGQLPPGSYLSLHRCHELRGIRVASDQVEIGALATYADVRDHAVIVEEFPMLAQAARESGAIAIQNRGTLGGNVMNASPAGDSPPALLAYEAEVVLGRRDGLRIVPLDAFFTGYRQTDRRPDELLVAVRLPRRPTACQTYEKVGTRAYQAISKVCFAGLMRPSGDAAVLGAVRVGLGSVAPTPIRARHLEAALSGARRDDPTLPARAAAAILADVSPIDDIRSNATYRRRVSANLAESFAKALVTAG